MANNELVTPLGDSAMDETNDALKVTLATALAGEDVTNDVTKVEQRGADFGITPEQYDEMHAAQGGACAICRATTNFTFNNLCVDHDHTNGRVRGLLCLNCNTALGQFKDSTSLLLKAADYLEGFK